MIVIIFWISAGLIAYTYLMFPLLILIRAKLAPRPYRQAAITPTVSIIIAAHNEAACIGRKIENLLLLDYPAAQIELLIASDGSTDETESIVRQFAFRGVRLLALPRGGKAKALNAAVAATRGEILVFSDANSMFERGALRALVAPFADPEVGGVAGDQRYDGSSSSHGADVGERRYWDLDRWLKRAESQAGCVISATGAIYAIRRSLFQTVPEGVTDDFVTSTRVIAQGRRLVFSEEAAAWEPPAAKQQAEFARKVRIITRGFRALACMKCLLNPLRFRFYSLQLLSHKLLRRLMVVPLLALLISSLMLLDESFFYRVAAYGQLAFYFAALTGGCLALVGQRLPKVAALPMYFCLVNAAALVAAVRVVSGRSTVLWVPQRAAGG
jgi:cellulose synthase/poly-beta-1,6-N-acetylglucosamine synthase-like glycosyltransferase